ncbi:MAG: DUF3108 domain-containing protein [Chlorobi bacterium]|nr:DUF3108 domain-containing protein [Chlorobiota bacterium]
MKNFLRLPIVAVFVFIMTTAFSQECTVYFPLDEGTEVEMTNYDKKGKVESTYTQKIEKKEVDGDNLDITILQKIYDDKGEFLHEGRFGMRCEDGNFYVDMRSFLDEEMMSAYEGMELQVDSKDMAIPSDLSVGMSLPDANISIAISNQGFKIMTLTVDITERKVEAQEDITTPSGTFNCYKMTYHISTKMGVRISGNATEWLAKDVGIVKSENYNKKGKLQSYTLLTGLKK